MSIATRSRFFAFVGNLCHVRNLRITAIGFAICGLATCGGITNADTAKVQLGEASLTTGISGSDDLKTSEIEEWIADPTNHEEIEFVLPLGLASGAGMIRGINENPLTRAKIELGRQLFFDTRLSGDNTVSCASCHRPDHGYAAPTQFGVGIRDQLTGVNSPTSYNRILSDKQFWDGRADSLEEQAKGPIAAPAVPSAP